MRPSLDQPSGWRSSALLAAGVVVAAGLALAPTHGGAPRSTLGTQPGVLLGHVVTASAPTSGSVVIGKDAADHGYETKVVTISQGATLSVVNLDSISHTVTSVAHGVDGAPLFDAFVPAGATVAVDGAGQLAAGRYSFYCRFHPTMRGTLVVEGGSGGVTPAPASFDQPLRLPKVLTGAHLRIPIVQRDVQVLPTGPATPMWTFGGSYPGPTIRRPAGAATTVTFTDHLPSSTGSLTIHLHGDHHPAADDGQPDRYLIKPGASRTYHYPLTDGGRPEHDAFDFYHDHRMGKTGLHAWHGLDGMVIVDSRRERSLPLPAGKYDVPLMVSDRSFNADNTLTDPFATRSPVPGDATVGDQVLVDGRVTPYFDVDTHRYRLRLLNTSNFQSYDFALSNGRPLVQIGTGAGLLPKPVVRQDILLGPAQRADVVVDFHGELHKDVVLESIPRTDNAPRGIGTPSLELMQFRVTARGPADHTRVPATLEPVPTIHAPAHVSHTWTFGQGGDSATGTYWTVDGHPYDPHTVDVRVPLGSTQTWLLKNLTSITHYVHLHEEEWHTIARDGKRPPPWERGLEDTWRLDPGESVKVAAQFTDYPGVFMVHCHMLDHEDDGMMAQFAVVRGKHGALPRGYHPARTGRTSAGMRMGAMTLVAPALATDVPRSATATGGRAHTVILRMGVALAAEFLLVVVVRTRRRRRARA